MSSERLKTLLQCGNDLFSSNSAEVHDKIQDHNTVESSSFPSFC